MENKDYQKLPYRKCVGVFLINNENKVFVGKRIDNNTEAWQMPQGGVDEGEDIEKSALRELSEETSVKTVAIIDRTKDWLHYDLPEKLIPKIWNGKYRGQKQIWFLMRFEGDESEINIQTKNPEFKQWKWTNPESLPSIIVPFKKQLYIDVLENFKNKL